MGFYAEDDALLPGLRDAPRKLIASALPGVRGLFIVELNSRQRGNVFRAAGGGVIKCFQKPLARMTTTRCFRMIHRVGDEAGIHLEKNISATEAAVGEFAAELLSGLARRLEFPRRPQMRATFKEANVSTVEFKHGNQVQDLVVREQREREIGASES